MIKSYNWVSFALLLILSCGNPINIETPTYSNVRVTKATFYDQLIIKGERFKNIRAVALADPKTNQIIKNFKVVKYSDDQIIGEQLDYNKIPIPNLLNLLIDTAQGQSVIPVQFTINANSVYTGAIQNGAIIPTKLKGVTANPTITSVLSYNPTTDNFFFSASSGGGGGSSGVSEITYGEGIVGDGQIATGTVDITVNVGETGSATSTFIPYFNNQNAIELNSSVNTNTRLLFNDGSEQVSLSFDAGLFRIHDETISLPSTIGDLLTIDASSKVVTVPGSLYVGNQTVCLANGNGCPTNIQPITGVSPIIVTGSQISADTGVNPGQLLKLGPAIGSATSSLPAVDGSLLLNNVTKITATNGGITVSNGGVGIVDLGLAPAGSTGSAQPWSPALSDISNIAYPPVNGEVIIGSGGNYVGQSGATFRASTGLAIGSDVQAWDSDLQTIAGFVPTPGQFIIANGAGAWSLGNTGNCGAGFVMTGTGANITCNDTSFVFKTRETQFYETAANGTNYVSLVAAAALPGDTIWTLPVTDGANGSVLTTNGSGQLSWGTGNGDVRGPASSVNRDVAIFSGTTGKVITDSNILIDNLVSRTTTPVISGDLSSFNGTTGALIQDSGIAANQVVTSVNNFPAINRVILSAVAASKSVTQSGYTVPSSVCPIGQILKSDGTNFTCQIDNGDVTGPAGSIDNNLASFNGVTGKIIKDSAIKSADVMTMGTASVLIGNILTTAGGKSAQDSGTSLANIPTMAAPAGSSNTLILSSAADKTLKSSGYTVPGSICPVGQILKSDGVNFICQNDSDTVSVSSVFSRTGAVVAVSGDYTATQITNSPAGNIVATEVQTALNELDSEKLALAGGTMTGAINTNSAINSSAQTALQLGPFGAAAGNTGEIHFMELAATGINYVGFKAPDNIIGLNTIWTLPGADGASGTVLTTNGSKTLSWNTPSSLGIGDVIGPISSSDNAIARFDSTTGKLIQNSVVILSDNGDLTGVRDLNSTGNFSVNGSGSFTGALSAQSYTNTSDRSLKKDIEPFIGASTIIDNLMPVTFRWKKGDDKKVIGLIAQDIEKVIPEVITTSNVKGRIIRSYDVGQVLVLTLEALKETREQLKQTRNEMKVLREKIKELEESNL